MCGKGKEAGCANGPAAEARFWYPAGLALGMNEDLIDAEGNTNRLMSRARQAAQETAGNRSPCALKDYGKLLEDPMAADVTFVVDGQRVTVAF